jgi:hypothetical protein
MRTSRQFATSSWRLQVSGQRGVDWGQARLHRMTAKRAKQEAQAKAACAVACVTLTPRGRCAGIECPQVGDDVLKGLKREYERPVVPWYKYDQMRKIVQQDGLSGLVLLCIQGNEPAPTLPSPFCVEFEPLELDETHPALQGLCAREGLSRAGMETPRARSWMRRVFQRYVIPIVFLGAIVAYGVMELGPTKSILTSLGCSSLIVLAVSTPILVVWWRSGKWYLVPGGVIVRAARFPTLSTLLYRCTPLDTTLEIVKSRWSWRSVLYQGRCSWSRSVSDLECFALLAAWQSPLEPPPLDDISDLR